MQRLVDKHDLAERYRIGANNLIDSYRKLENPCFNDFTTSIEHIAFYLSTDEAKTIKRPRAYILRTLERGYYAEPAGFESSEERDLRQKLEDQQKRQEKIASLKRHLFDSEFETWLMDLDDDSRSSLLRGSVFEDMPASEAAKGFLRTKFTKLTGKVDPCN